MSNKIQNVYICSNCDAQSSKWSGRCAECGSWGTLSESVVDKKTADKKTLLQLGKTEAVPLSQVSQADLTRMLTGIGEVDRVFGGGLVPGSLVLLSGEPGIGKSTLVAQIADAVASGSPDSRIAYASGEESAAQVRDRFSRLDCHLEKIDFLGETNVEKIIATLRALKPQLAIVDSIQTVYSAEVLTEAGGVSQIRAATAKFLEYAKQNNVAVILIGHITKDGAIAGPKSLEHIVDTVLYLETDPSQAYRILRTSKNRFGSTNETGIFEMTGGGFKEIKNPSAFFIDQQSDNLSGSAISAVLEGTRVFMVEIQALVTKTTFGYPQRKSSGFDLNRLQVLTAVMTKRANINLSTQDIVLNLVGGLQIKESGLDLAACAAIISSVSNLAIGRQTVILGEVGLGGEVRNVSRLDQRLQEAEKLGFTHAIIPDVPAKTKLKAIKIKNISELSKIL